MSNEKRPSVNCSSYHQFYDVVAWNEFRGHPLCASFRSEISWGDAVSAIKSMSETGNASDFSNADVRDLYAAADRIAAQLKEKK